MDFSREPKDNWVAGHLCPRRTSHRSEGQDVHFDGADVYPSGIRFWFSWRIRDTASLAVQRERIRQVGSFRTADNPEGPHLEVVVDGNSFNLPSGPGHGTERFWALNFWLPWEVSAKSMNVALTWREQDLYANVHFDANEIETALSEAIELWPPSEDQYQSVSAPS